MKSFKYTLILAAIIQIFTTSCNAQCDHPIVGTDASIISCRATVGQTIIETPVSTYSVEILLPKSLISDAVKVEMSCSEGAEISPNPASINDWREPKRFTVTSADRRQVNSYTVRVSYSSVDGGEFNASVRIGTQTALDAFAANNYSKLGSLYLFTSDASDSITDISVLSSLKEVRTELEIVEIAAKKIVLENLESVGNFDMHSIQTTYFSMPALKNVAGRFRIGNDDSGEMPTQHERLITVNLPSLVSVGRSLVLAFCSGLEEIVTPNLAKVGQDINIFGGLVKDLKFIQNIKSVNGMLRVYTELESLEGFNVESIKTSLYLKLNSVTTLEPLSKLKQVPYILMDRGNLLTSFKGVENIVIEALDLKGFDKIKSTQYLPIRDGMKHLSISSMLSLSDLSGFEKIVDIGVLSIASCPQIKNLDPIAGIQSVNHLSLVMLDGLTALPTFKFTEIGKLSISMMRKLESISGLESLERAKYIQIDNTVILESLSGLENFKKITGGSLVIEKNLALTNLNALSNLSEVLFAIQSDGIRISSNPALIDYTGAAQMLIKYWNEMGGKTPRVNVKDNKYNPTLIQLKNGQYIMP